MLGFLASGATLEGARRIAKAIGIALAIVILLELIRRIYNRCPQKLKVPFKVLSAFILAQPFMVLILSYQRLISDPELLNYLASIHFHPILFTVGLLFFTLISYRILGWYIDKVNHLTSVQVKSYPRRVWEFIKRPFVRKNQAANPPAQP